MRLRTQQVVEGYALNERPDSLGVLDEFEPLGCEEILKSLKNKDGLKLAPEINMHHRRTAAHLDVRPATEGGGHTRAEVVLRNSRRREPCRTEISPRQSAW